MLGLGDEIGGDERSRRRRVGDDRDLGRAGEGVDADVERDLVLGEGDPERARPDDLVDAPDRLGSVGHRRDRLCAAALVDLGCPGDLERGEGRGVDAAAVGCARDARDDLLDAGQERRQNGHERGRGICGPAARHVAPDPAQRPGLLPDAHRVGADPPPCGPLLGELRLVVGADPVGGRAESVEQRRFASSAGRGKIRRRHAPRLRRGPAEPLRRFAHRFVPAGAHFGDQRPHGCPCGVPVHDGTRQPLERVARVSAQVNEGQHGRPILAEQARGAPSINRVRSAGRLPS